MSDIEDKTKKGGRNIALLLIGVSAISLIFYKLIKGRFPWEKEEPTTPITPPPSNNTCNAVVNKCTGQNEIGICNSTTSHIWKCVQQSEYPESCGLQGTKPSDSTCSNISHVQSCVFNTSKNIYEWVCQLPTSNPPNNGGSNPTCSITIPQNLTCLPGQVGICNAQTSHVWKCESVDGIGQYCGTSTTKPPSSSCSNNTSPYCSLFENTTYKWTCPSKNKDQVIAENQLKKEIFPIWGTTSSIDIYMKDSIPVFPSIGANCTFNSTTPNQWKGDLSEADLALVNNPKGVIVQFNELKFVKEVEYQNAGIVIYKNNAGFLCTRNNPCRDSTGKITGRLQQQASNESFTGECVCDDSHHGELCQCLRSCRLSSEGMGFVCEC